MSTNQVLMFGFLGPLMILWVLHEFGFNTPVVRVLCWIVRAVTFGKWRPKAEDVDGVAAISVSGVGLGILTVVLASWVS